MKPFTEQHCPQDSQLPTSTCLPACSKQSRGAIAQARTVNDTKLEWTTMPNGLALDCLTDCKGRPASHLGEMLWLARILNLLLLFNRFLSSSPSPISSQTYPPTYMYVFLRTSHRYRHQYVNIHSFADIKRSKRSDKHRKKPQR